MTINGSANYATANAFRRSLEDRIKREARAKGRSMEELRREFLFQRFLALLFSAPGGPWMLKGGGGLLMRLADARFSRDLDLLRLGELTSDEAIAELRELTAPREGDHLRFVIEDGVSFSRVNPIVEINVTAYIGAKYGGFPIDLARELHFVADPERVRPSPVVEVPGLQTMPEVTVYPLTDQVVDKVSAMYELYGEHRNPSSRFRDLVDLALIVTACELDGRMLTLGIASEQQRRQTKLPSAMGSPGPNWASGYAAVARKSRLEADLHNMDAALEAVGCCLDPILSGERDAGLWIPQFGWKD